MVRNLLQRGADVLQIGLQRLTQLLMGLPFQQAVDQSLLIALQGTEHGRQGVFAGIEGIQQLDQAVGGLARGGDDDQLVAAPLLLDEAGHPAITARIGQTTATKFMNLTTAQLLSTL